MYHNHHKQQFWGDQGQRRRPLESNSEGGKIRPAPSVFWQVIPTCLQEIQNFQLR